MSEKRRCQGKNKLGNPCGAMPMAGVEWCNTHNPSLPDGIERFGSGPGQVVAARLGGAATRKPRVIDLLRERLEEEFIEPAIKAFVDSLDASRAVVVTDKDGNESVQYVTDHGMRMRAAAEMFDRSYGKPKQVTEISGPDGVPIQLEAPVDSGDRSARAAALLARSGLLETGEEAGSGLGGPNGGLTNGGGGNGHGH